MTKPKNDLTAEQVRAVLHYSPETGVLTWRVDTGTAKALDTAGVVGDHGYVLVGLRRRVYRAHRLAWLWVHGRWPTGSLDHVDGDRQNNRLSNLREATHTQNLQNSKRAREMASGLKGAYPTANGQTWTSRIRHNGRSVYLGCFSTPEAAHAAYRAAAERLFGEFARFD